jgi:hypothetical protein
VNYLQLVNKAIARSGCGHAQVTSLAGETDIVVNFIDWVQDAWRELQEESTNWWFRAKLDQTLSIVQGTDEYAMPSGLETLNYRTVTIYTDSKTDETPVRFIKYEEWRTDKDTVESGQGRPIYITERPDGVLQIWPVPDQAYTLRYDGVWDIDEMLIDTDTPGFNTTGAQTLQDRYHYVLVWDAIRRYAEHYEDPESLQKAQSKYLAQHARLTEKRRPPIYVKVGTLTGLGDSRYVRRGGY